MAVEDALVTVENLPWLEVLSKSSSASQSEIAQEKDVPGVEQKRDMPNTQRSLC